MWNKAMRRRQGNENGYYVQRSINPLNAKLNPIRHLLALVGARHIVHVSRIRVKLAHEFVSYDFFLKREEITSSTEGLFLRSAFSVR